MAEYFDEDAYSKAMEKSNHIARIKDSINAAQIAAEMSLKCNNT